MVKEALNSKKSQISLADYMKLKEKRAQSKLKLHFPLLVKISILIPAAYLLFMVTYYLVYLRFLAEH